MLVIFSNDFRYPYYELKMRKHGWNRMLNCAFTKKIGIYGWTNLVVANSPAMPQST